MDKRHRAVKEASLLLGLPSTAQLLLLVLAKEGRELPISHLLKKTKRSERALRQHLSHLVRTGLLKKRMGRTEKRRRACFYSLDLVQFLKGVGKILEEKRERAEKILEEYSKG